MFYRKELYTMYTGPTNKTRFLLLILLTMIMISSLACLQGAVVADKNVMGTPRAVGTLFNTPISTSSATQAPTAGAVSDQCAEVIAARSLNLRSRASEHAPVLTWLKRGEVVELIGAGNSDWWLIRSGEVVGFARSIYLHRKACE